VGAAIEATLGVGAATGVGATTAASSKAPGDVPEAGSAATMQALEAIENKKRRTRAVSLIFMGRP
jgi:hypothetical protein